jgi:hypothetical protein
VVALLSKRGHRKDEKECKVKTTHKVIFENSTNMNSIPAANKDLWG